MFSHLVTHRQKEALILERFGVSSKEKFLEKLKLFVKDTKAVKSEGVCCSSEKHDRQDILHSTLWNEGYYLSQFNYIFSNENLLPVDHYIKIGWKLGYNPSPFFNGNDYLSLYSEINTNPLLYFIQKGRFLYKDVLKNYYPFSEDIIGAYWRNKKKNNKVVYMCITNDYDDLDEICAHYYVNPEWDYVCFSDNPKYLRKKIVGIWKIKPLKYKKLDGTRNNRWHKFFPHKLFKNYKESIYIDSNVNILTPFLFDEIKRRDVDLLLPKHATNQSIYEEYLWGLSSEIDDFFVIAEELEEIMISGFPPNYGMPECNIIYRKHNSDRIKKLMEDWWFWVSSYAKRDQFAFSYLLWKYKISVRECTFVNARIAYKDFSVFKHKSKRGIK